MLTQEDYLRLSEENVTKVQALLELVRTYSLKCREMDRLNLLIHSRGSEHPASQEEVVQAFTMYSEADDIHNQIADFAVELLLKTQPPVTSNVD